MSGFFSFFSHGRRLAASTGTSDSLEAGDEQVVFEEDENAATPPGADGPAEYIETELHIDPNAEPRTTRTTKPSTRGGVKVPFDVYQWMALAAATIAVLSAGAWNMAGKFPGIFGASKDHVSSRALTLDPNNIRWKLDALKEDVITLQDEWDEADEKVRTAFTAAYLGSGAEKDKNRALELITEQVNTFLSFDIPEEPKEEDSIKDIALKTDKRAVYEIQAELLLGAVQAARARLGLFAALSELPVPEPLPPAEEMVKQKTDLVDIAGFFAILTKAGNPPMPSTVGVPRQLAEHLAHAFYVEDLMAVADEKVRAGFGGFVDAVLGPEGKNHDTPVRKMLPLPTGDSQFAAEAFVNLVGAVEQVRGANPVPVSAIESLGVMWNVPVVTGLLAQLSWRAVDISNTAVELTDKVLAEQNALKVPRDFFGLLVKMI